MGENDRNHDDIWLVSTFDGNAVLVLVNGLLELLEFCVGLDSLSFQIVRGGLNSVSRLMASGSTNMEKCRYPARCCFYSISPQMHRSTMFIFSTNKIIKLLVICDFSICI